MILITKQKHRLQKTRANFSKFWPDITWRTNSIYETNKLPCHLCQKKLHKDTAFSHFTQKHGDDAVKNYVRWKSGLNCLNRLKETVLTNRKKWLKRRIRENLMKKLISDGLSEQEINKKINASTELHADVTDLQANNFFHNSINKNKIWGEKNG